MRRLRRTGDAGMVSAFVVTIVLALLFAAGLAYDAGRLVDARIAAADLAASAARAGAQRTAVDADGHVAIDPRAAERAAAAFADDGGARVEVYASVDAVTVTARRTVELAFLRLFGMGRKSVRATERATPVEG